MSASPCLLSEYNAGKREGIEIEKMNTEKERRRAETAIKRAEELEKELLRLRETVAEKGV